MTARARQAAALACALTESTGTPCRVELHFASDLGGAGWRIHWSDGPGVTAMQTAVAEVVADIAPLLTDLGYERGESDVGAATSLLWWLAQDYPGQEGPIDLWFVLHSGVGDVLPGHPDAAPDDVQRLARVLTAHGWTASADTPIAGELEAHARGGWPAIARWLGALEAAPSLAARRATRGT